MNDKYAWVLCKPGTLTFPRGRSGKGVKGPRSLLAMTLRILGNNINRVSESEDLSDLPKKVLVALAKELLPRSISFHAWKLLIKPLAQACHPDDPETKSIVPQDVWHYLEKLYPPPACDLSVYTFPLTSPSLDFVAKLSILAPSRFPTHQVLSLSGMPNLRILHIDDTQGEAAPVVTDRLVRGWNEASPRPFPILESLLLESDSDQLSVQAAEYASKFAALRDLGICSPSIPQTSRKGAEVYRRWGWHAEGERPIISPSSIEAHVILCDPSRRANRPQRNTLQLHRTRGQGADNNNNNDNNNNSTKRKPEDQNDRKSDKPPRPSKKPRQTQNMRALLLEFGTPGV
ncbi:hypothetical protein QBC42DRAFT_296070 [Cladorrhinum samala]|uniref:Uncharacterized protein n=1 Tax=Cladorrhinum samala TaxID=585594 RepID=A0AAV9HRC9_9PEZI|nr:hypothetical protein QBC42DRAFT_296070 [Cladorrhinum samala]